MRSSPIAAMAAVVTIFLMMFTACCIDAAATSSLLLTCASPNVTSEGSFEYRCDNTTTVLSTIIHVDLSSSVSSGATSEVTLDVWTDFAGIIVEGVPSGCRSFIFTVTVRAPQLQVAYANRTRKEDLISTVADVRNVNFVVHLAFSQTTFLLHDITWLRGFATTTMSSGSMQMSLTIIDSIVLLLGRCRLANDTTSVLSIVIQNSTVTVREVMFAVEQRSMRLTTGGSGSSSSSSSMMSFLICNRSTLVMNYSNFLGVTQGAVSGVSLRFVGGSTLSVPRGGSSVLYSTWGIINVSLSMEEASTMSVTTGSALWSPNGFIRDVAITSVSGSPSNSIELFQAAALLRVDHGAIGSVSLTWSGGGLIRILDSVFGWAGAFDVTHVNVTLEGGGGGGSAFHLWLTNSAFFYNTKTVSGFQFNVGSGSQVTLEAISNIINQPDNIVDINYTFVGCSLVITSKSSIVPCIGSMIHVSVSLMRAQCSISDSTAVFASGSSTDVNLIISDHSVVTMTGAMWIRVSGDFSGRSVIEQGSSVTMFGPTPSLTSRSTYWFCVTNPVPGMTSVVVNSSSIAMNCADFLGCANTLDASQITIFNSTIMLKNYTGFVGALAHLTNIFVNVSQSNVSISQSAFLQSQARVEAITYVIDQSHIVATVQATWCLSPCAPAFLYGKTPGIASTTGTVKSSRIRLESGSGWQGAVPLIGSCPITGVTVLWTLCIVECFDSTILMGSTSLESTSMDIESSSFTISGTSASILSSPNIDTVAITVRRSSFVSSLRGAHLSSYYSTAPLMVRSVTWTVVDRSGVSLDDGGYLVYGVAVELLNVTSRNTCSWTFINGGGLVFATGSSGGASAASLAAATAAVSARHNVSVYFSQMTTVTLASSSAMVLVGGPINVLTKILVEMSGGSILSIERGSILSWSSTASSNSQQGFGMPTRALEVTISNSQLSAAGNAWLTSSPCSAFVSSTVKLVLNAVTSSVAAASAAAASLPPAVHGNLSVVVSSTRTNASQLRHDDIIVGSPECGVATMVPVVTPNPIGVLLAVEPVASKQRLVVIALAAAASLASAGSLGSSVMQMRTSAQAISLMSHCTSADASSGSTTGSDGTIDLFSPSTSSSFEEPISSDVFSNPLQVSIIGDAFATYKWSFAAGSIVGNAILLLLLVGASLVKQCVWQPLQEWWTVHKCSLDAGPIYVHMMRDRYLEVASNLSISAASGGFESYQSLVQPCALVGCALLIANDTSVGAKVLGVVVGIGVWVLLPSISYARLVCAEPFPLREGEEVCNDDDDDGSLKERLVCSGCIRRIVSPSGPQWLPEADISELGISPKPKWYCEQLADLVALYRIGKQWFLMVDVLAPVLCALSAGVGIGIGTCSVAVLVLWLQLFVTVAILLGVFLLHPFTSYLELGIAVLNNALVIAVLALLLEGNDVTAATVALVQSIIGVVLILPLQVAIPRWIAMKGRERLLSASSAITLGGGASLPNHSSDESARFDGSSMRKNSVSSPRSRRQRRPPSQALLNGAVGGAVVSSAVVNRLSTPTSCDTSLGSLETLIRTICQDRQQMLL